MGEEGGEGRRVKQREIKYPCNETRSQLILKIIIKPAIKRVNYVPSDRAGGAEYLMSFDVTDARGRRSSTFPNCLDTRLFRSAVDINLKSPATRLQYLVYFKYHILSRDSDNTESTARRDFKGEAAKWKTPSYKIIMPGNSNFIGQSTVYWFLNED